VERARFWPPSTRSRADLRRHDSIPTSSGCVPRFAVLENDAARRVVNALHAPPQVRVPLLQGWDQDRKAVDPAHVLLASGTLLHPRQEHPQGSLLAEVRRQYVV
jgi:hypothetical protein